MGVKGSFLKKKTEALLAELNERVEAATTIYSVTGVFLEYICSMLVVNNRQKIRSRCLVHEFSFTDIFNNINHGYRAAILNKNSLWLFPFYMAVVTYCYYEKVHRTMRTAIVSYIAGYISYMTQGFTRGSKGKTNSPAYPILQLI